MQLFVTNEEYAQIRRLNESCLEYKAPNLMDINCDVERHNEPFFNENRWLSGLFDMFGDIPTGALPECKVVVVPKVDKRWSE